MRADPSPAPPLAGSGDPHNAFTVDLEEWFHVCGVERLRFERWTALPSRVEPTTRWLLDALDRADVRATFFIVGWVAERFPRLVEAVRAAGHEIGSHGHAHRRVYELDNEAFRRDLRASVQALKAAGVDDVSLFRAPEWSVNDRSLWALDVLVEEGFRLDASMAPLTMVGSLRFPRHPHVRQTAAGPIVEVPPLVADLFGQVMPLGWGWGLRMSSPRRVLDTIERLNRRGQPAVLTVHPWEIDPDPPRVRLPARLHFAHYFRIGGFADRLRAILSGGYFGPIGRIVPTASAGA
jgi:polysaccharide deacetylase family protein (PEP-CTERM system associated)